MRKYLIPILIILAVLAWYCLRRRHNFNMPDGSQIIGATPAERLYWKWRYRR